LIKSEPITDIDLIDELYEICDHEHSSCNSDCPVYFINNCKVLDTANDFKINRGCDCFKDGRKMLNFIRNNDK
jgi:hypothetical protein